VTRTSRLARNYAIAVVGVGLATAIGMLVRDHVTIADQAMLYLPAILVAALGGRGPSLAAAALSVGAFDFFFVPPRFTFAVSDMRSLITFVVMFVVGTAIGGLVARLRAAEEASREREHRTAALLAFTRDAAAATDVAGVEAAIVSHVRGVVGAVARVEVPDVALHGPVAIRLEGEPALTPDQHAFLEAVAHQGGVAIGRLQLATAARDAALRAKAEELRSALLSSVSHDLRTPLAAITGMATSLRERTDGDNEELDTIIAEAQRLSRLLTNLLSITKVESGAEPRREWVPLEEIVGSVLVRLETELADHPVAVELPPGALARIDPILVEQMLLNVLDNAAKHTAAGTPIEIRVTREPDAATIEIADRGPGLPPGPRAQVFDKFFRGKTSAAGAGLGLAVCRGIAAAHGGTIEAWPRDGGGARFVARFPDGAPLPEVSEAEADEPEAPAMANAS
jgi:two-component system, OmpR family, sensor histidine kinase KdpD